jgi:hypothetical protein
MTCVSLGGYLHSGGVRQPQVLRGSYLEVHVDGRTSAWKIAAQDQEFSQCTLQLTCMGAYM